MPEGQAYNSCRNRHCPKCQALTRARWLEQEAKHLLPVAYHHVVFILPAELRELVLANPAVLYDLLMRSAAATLRDVAANPKRLGALPGVLMVLHTWGQNLHHHPHVHCVVSGGGLSCDAKGKIDASPRWVSCRPGFFLPVRVLSRVFRGKFLAGLRKAIDAGELIVPPALADPVARGRLLATLSTKDWVVYAKPPFGGPERVLKYLARYTHRVAISNARLLELRDGRVTFRLQELRRRSPAQDHDAGGGRVFCGVSCSTYCPKASSRFGTTGCWPMPSARRGWRSAVVCCWWPRGRDAGGPRRGAAEARAGLLTVAKPMARQAGDDLAAARRRKS